MIDDRVRLALLPCFPAGTQIILTAQNGPRPAGDYVTVRADVAGRSNVIVGKQDDAGNQPRDAHRSGNVEVQAFGQNSHDLLDEALQRLGQESAMEAAEAQGVVFGPTNTVNSVPALLNESQYEPRAVAVVPFSYTLRTQEALSWIETVEAQAEIDKLPVLNFTATIADN